MTLTTSNSTSVINTTSSSMGCIILQFEEYIPWDNPDNIVSLETEDIVHTLKDLVFLPLLFLIGCPANVINLIVFYRQGLKERINVCLFALSLADELYLINNIPWFPDQLYVRLFTKNKIGPILTFLLNNNLLGLHGFIWVSQVISAIIATDRCFCVSYPLRSQTFIRTSTMTFIIIVVSVVVLSVVSLELMRYRVECVYDPVTKHTVVTAISSEFYHRHRQLIHFMDVFVLGVGLPGSAMIVVITTTIITAIKLRQAASWRAGSTSGIGISERDIAMTRMLLVNSVFFIACVLPHCVFRFVFLFMPNVNTGGRQHNFYVLIQWILVTMGYFNATFNIVIYYTMGSRYRQTFWQLFGRTIKKNGK